MPWPECEYHEGEDALDCRACEKLHDEFVAWVRSINPQVRRGEGGLDVG